MRALLTVLAAIALAPCALAQPAPAVTVAPLAEVAIHPERDASAQVVSLNESRIAAEIAGRLEVMAVEVGQRVERGALLARLDCRDHQLARERAAAALAAAQARQGLAEQQLRRGRELRAQGFVSDEALAGRVTEVAVLSADATQAGAQLASAARAVDKCVVRAPFSAIVRERLGQVGELAAPGTPLALLVDAERIEVSAQVQAKDVRSLEQAARPAFVGLGGARALVLLRVSPAIDRQARTLEARLRFTGAAAAPGAAGRVTWRDTAPHLAPEFLVRRDSRLGVFVDDGGTARFHALPDAQEGRPARADLPPGARIVVKGQLTLRDGQRLR